MSGDNRCNAGERFARESEHSRCVSFADQVLAVTTREEAQDQPRDGEVVVDDAGDGQSAREPEKTRQIPGSRLPNAAARRMSFPLFRRPSA